jgi:hypothetical protein
MPSITLNDDDLLKAINFLTDDKYNMNRIISKRLTPDGKLNIFWTYKNKSMELKE